MYDPLKDAQILLLKRSVELAHYRAMEHLTTGLIATKRQIEHIQRVPQPGESSVELERLRERYQQLACIIEADEMPALVDLITKIIRSEQ